MSKQTDQIKSRVRCVGQRLSMGDKLMGVACTILKELSLTGHTFKFTLIDNARTAVLTAAPLGIRKPIARVSYNNEVAGQLTVKKDSDSSVYKSVGEEAEMGMAIGDLVVEYCRQNGIKEL